MATPRITIPNTKVEAGKKYSIPVNAAYFPAGCTSFELIVTCEEQMLEMVGIDRTGMLAGEVLSEFNNGVPVPGYVTPYSKGKMIVVAASALPLKGKPMFNIQGMAKKSGTVAFGTSYLLLDTNCLYGIRPELKPIQ